MPVPSKPGSRRQGELLPAAHAETSNAQLATDICPVQLFTNQRKEQYNEQQIKDTQEPRQRPRDRREHDDRRAHMNYEWKVIPRVEKTYPPGATVPIPTTVRYDVMEYRDGREAWRNEFSTLAEAEVFAEHERQSYKEHLAHRNDPPSPLLVAAFWSVVLLFAIALVKLVLHVAGVD